MEWVEMQEWCILRVIGETVQTVGYVWAADEEAAISEALNRGLAEREQELVAHQVPQAFQHPPSN